MKAWYYHFKEKLTEMECENLKNYALQQPFQVGKVGGDNQLNESIRKSDVVFLKRNDPQLYWLFDRLALTLLEANDRCFNFALNNYPNLSYVGAQFTQYSAEDQQRYDWHSDVDLVADERTQRKLSLCVQLSDPKTYSGGAFEMETSSLECGHFSSLGDVIVFPSFIKHRVTSVTSGTRHSLVNWYLGPQLT